MSKRAKAPILLIIFIVLLVLSLGSLGMVGIALKDEYAKTASLQEELKNAKDMQKMLEAKVEESKKTVQGIEAKLKDNLAQIESLNKELQNEKSQKQEVLSQVESLRSDLTQQQSLRSELENKLALSLEEIKKTQQVVSNLEGKKAELEVKIKELEEKSQGVELGTIVVGPESAKPEIPLPAVASEINTAEPVKTETAKAKPVKPVKPAKPVKEQKQEPVGGLEGKILVVNKDYNFAVINLGSKDGVGVGNLFALYHNNKYIGDAKIEKVHDSMSAAGFLADDMKNKVSEGDKALPKNK